MSQTFNALNGQELKKAILASMEHEMDLSGEFKFNITYPWVKWDANLKVLSYPKQNIGDVPAIDLTAVGEKAEVKDGVVAPAPESPEVVLDLNLGRVVNTPDAEREKTAQPIPTQAVGPGGQTVDKPMISPRSPVAAAPVLPKRETKAKPDVSSGSPIGVPGIDGSAQ